MQWYATHAPTTAAHFPLARVKLFRSGYDDQKLSSLLGLWAGLSNDPLLVGLSADCVEHGPQGCGHPTHIADVRKRALLCLCCLSRCRYPLPLAVTPRLYAHAGHNKKRSS